MFKKFIFFLAWIGVFLLSLIGIVYAAVPKYFVQFNKYVDTIGYSIIVGIISIIYLVICIVKLCSLFERSKDYTIKTENGIVYISSDTVTTFIKEKLAGNRDISNIKIDTYKSGTKFNVKIRLDMISDGTVSDKLERIQKEIKEDLSNEMGIEVGKVQVKISRLSIKEKNENTNKNNTEYESFNN
ncbi:alkaline shock response membrane anchor protein AmaP [Fusobacterium sp.]|uniref:alkaline shock response membrane anchor protein AmaP n=1 Tax=Fusobacterium sp. TaxID=68766 RepID=UPI00396C9028